jgi:hypothetical protein
MSGDRIFACACCGAEIAPEVPKYFVELECLRLIREREEKVPRRGSKEYHDAMERLLPEIQQAYFGNQEMYDHGHLWCPECGRRLDRQREVGGS